MRPRTFVRSTAAAGSTPWVMMDYHQNPFSVGFSVDVQGTGTYTIEHGFSNLEKKVVGLSRSTTVATLKSDAHGLQVGDSLVVEGADAPFSGTFPVATVTDANNVTYTVANSGAAAAVDGRALFIRVFPHSSVAAQTVSKDGNYAYPVQFVRMTITVAGTGQYAFTISQGSN